MHQRQARRVERHADDWRARHPLRLEARTEAEADRDRARYLHRRPLKFDVAGKWAARFHFNEDCNDGDESPHGHTAFFVSVP